MKQFEQRLLKYLQVRNWDTLRPADISKSIMIEGAELLEVFQWDSPSLEDVKRDPDKLAKISKELADVMIYSFEMAVLLGLDVNAILHQKLDRAEEKYPVDLFADVTPSNPESMKAYWEQKERYRREGKN